MPLRYLTRDQLLLKLGPLSPYATQIIEQPEATRYPVDAPPGTLSAGAVEPSRASVGYYRYIFSRARNHVSVPMTQDEYVALPSAPEAEFDPLSRRPAPTAPATAPAPITPLRVSKYAPRD